MAWSVAALRELELAWDWDARTAEVIVGTSAGAELACLLGGGVAVSALHQAHSGDPRAPAWISQLVDAEPGRFPPRPSPRIGSPKLVALALRGQAPPLVGLTAALPVGRGDTARLTALASRMAANGWVAHPATWLVAMDFDAGQRVAFGASGAPAASLGQALCASWALPGWLPPVAIGTRRYVDGGVLSPASADLVAASGLDEVIVLAPMASSRPGRPIGVIARAERLIRGRMTRILDAELELVRAAGARVLRFEPVGRDLAVMGGNFMDARRRSATLVSAAASIRQALAGEAA
jgi:NTE family protein